MSVPPRRGCLRMIPPATGRQAGPTGRCCRCRNIRDSPKHQCPMPEAWRPAFIATTRSIKQALDPLLLEHRARIFREPFATWKM